MNRQGSDGLKRLLEFGIGLCMQDKVPKLMHDKIVMSRTLRQRYEALGRPLHEDRCARYISTAGEMDWGQCGVYSFLDPNERGRYRQVKHCQLPISLPKLRSQHSGRSMRTGRIAWPLLGMAISRFH